MRPGSLEQVAQRSGVGIDPLQGLVAHGVLTPVMPVRETRAFRRDCIMTLQRAGHLRQDLALDDHRFALTLMRLGRITDLEDGLRIAGLGGIGRHGPALAAQVATC